MQWYGFIGNALIAWSPHVAIIFGYLRTHPQLIMVAVAACFWFVGAAHVCALLWLLIWGLKDSAAAHSMFGVVITEGCRYGFFRIYMKCEKVFGKSFDEVIYLTEYSVIPASVAAGCGWAAGQSLLGFGMLFAYHLDPTVTDADAILYSRSDCKDLSSLTFQAIQSMLYSISTIGCTVTSFSAYYSFHYPELESRKHPVHSMGTPLNKKLAWKLLIVSFVLHLSASFTGGFGLMCAASIPLLVVITLISSAVAVYVTKLVHKPRLEQGSDKNNQTADQSPADQQDSIPMTVPNINEDDNEIELQEASQEEEMIGEIIDPALGGEEEGIIE